MILCAVLVITIGLSVWFVVEARKSYSSFSTTSDYFLWGERDLSTTKFVGTFSGTNMTFTSSFLAVAVTAYTMGSLVVWLVAAFIAGLVLFGLLYRRTLGAWVAEGRVGSMHEFLGDHYGSRARRIGALNTILSFVGTIGLELLGIQLVLGAMAPQGRAYTVLAIGGFFVVVMLMAVYTLIGGFREVVMSDIRQTVVTVIGLALFGIAWLANTGLGVGGPRNVVVSIGHQLGSVQWNTVFVASMVVLFLPFQFCVMDMWQRCRATKAHPENVVKGAILSVPLVTLPLLMASAVGLFLKGAVETGAVPPLQQPNMAFFVGTQKLLEHLVVEQPVLYSLGMIGLGTALVMAAISTVDTLLSTIAYTTMIDLWSERRVDDHDGVGPKSSVLLNLPLSRTLGVATGIVIGAVVLGLVLTLLKWTLYDLALAVFGAQVSFAVPLALGFFAPGIASRVKRVVPAALLIGLITPPAAVVAGKLGNSPELISGAPVLAFVLVALLIVVAWPMSRRGAVSQPGE